MSRAILAALLLLIISGSSAALSWYVTSDTKPPETLARAAEPERAVVVTDEPDATPTAVTQSTQISPPLTPTADPVEAAPAATPTAPPLSSRTATERPLPTSEDEPLSQPFEMPQWSRATPPTWAPTRLAIPYIDVDAKVIGVALTDGGEMEAPEDYDEVGWYRLGVIPGQPGRSVLAGHVDSTAGPAIFYRLRDLTPGAILEITLGSGQETLRFVVEDTANYPEHEAPLDRIFGPSDRSELILITCSGDFDFSRGAYPDRLVIYAALLPEGE